MIKALKATSLEKLCTWGQKKSYMNGNWSIVWKNGSNLNFLEEWVNKLWYVHAMEYYIVVCVSG